MSGLGKGLQNLSLKAKKTSSSPKSSASSPKQRGSLIPKSQVTKTRRRLSVVGGSQDTKSYKIDGVIPDDAKMEQDMATTFKNYAYQSRVGYVPFNKAKQNQDRAIFHPTFAGSESKSFWGVLDGHGANGHFVSKWVKEKLPQNIAQHPALEKDTEKAMHEAYVQTNKLLAKSSIDCTFSGTTVVTAYITRNDKGGRTLYCSCAGDSRAVLAKLEGGKMTAEDLSIDQKPERADERKRIIATKGRVEACRDQLGHEIGPQRVWLLHQDVPGLAMTRSFGDLVAASVGVIPAPETKVRELVESDKFMIIASDGVWEFISSQEAVDIVHASKNAEEACKALYEESRKRWRAEEEVIDDITCLVVYL